MRRIRYVVSFIKRTRSWQVTRKGHSVLAFATKQEAVTSAAARCREAWRGRQPCELIIKGRDGRIRDNRTYGNDPRNTPG